MFSNAGVPSELDDLKPVIAHNRPYGSDSYSPHYVAEHLRSLYGFIAQLRDRIAELEKQQGIT